MPIARTTGRERKHAPAGSREAARILSEFEVREGLRLDDDDLAVLKKCCTDKPPRNAAAIVSAIKARLEYSQPKPKQEIGVEATVSYKLLDPFAKPPPHPLVREDGE